MRDRRLRSGPKPQGRDGDDDEVEAERGADGAALAPGKHAHRGGRAPRPASRNGSRAERELVREFHFQRRVARDDGDAALLQDAWRSPASSSLTEAASSETDGSSSSQIGRGAANRRMSASLRFCPADSRPAGRSAKARKPEQSECASRARARRRRGSRPRSATFSRNAERALDAVQHGPHSDRARAAATSAPPPSNLPRLQRQQARRSAATGSSCRRRSGRVTSKASPGLKGEAQVARTGACRRAGS